MPKPLINPVIGNIPYPAAAGRSGALDLSSLRTPQSPRQDAQGGAEPHTGDHVVFYNDSDSALTISMNAEPSSGFCPPGHMLDLLITAGESGATWTVLYQNPYQVHPAQTLTAVFYSRADIARGHVIVPSAINPSTPAAAIGPGALAEGVTIGADDVGAAGPAETLGAFAFLNPGQINAGALPEGVTIGADDVGTAAPSEFFGAFAQITAAKVGAAAAPDVMNLVDTLNIVTAALKVLLGLTFPSLPASGVQQLIQAFMSGDTGAARLGLGVRSDGFGFLQSSDTTTPNRSRLWGSATGWQSDQPLTASAFHGVADNVPAAGVQAGTLIAGVHETQLNSDAGKITSDGAGNLTLGELLSTQPGSAVAAVVVFDIQTTGTNIQHYIIEIQTDGSLRLQDGAGHVFFSMQSGVNIGAGNPMTLRSGVQETGFCGTGISPANALVSSYFVVNFRMHMTNTPTGITLVTTSSQNVNSGPVIDTITADGFMAHVNWSVVVGAGFWEGTYTTIGN